MSLSVSLGRYFQRISVKRRSSTKRDIILMILNDCNGCFILYEVEHAFENEREKRVFLSKSIFFFFNKLQSNEIQVFKKQA